MLFLLKSVVPFYLSNSLTKKVQFLSLEIIHIMLIANSAMNYL